MSEIACYESFQILSPDLTQNCNTNVFDFSLFDYIDLTFYGGNQFTAVTSNQDIIDAFAALSTPLEVDIDECLIYMKTLNQAVQDVNSHLDQCIELYSNDTLITPCINDSIDYTQFAFVDFTDYSGAIQPISSDTELDAYLTQLVQANNSEASVEITGCCIKLIKYTGTVNDLEVVPVPCIQVLIDDVVTTADQFANLYEIDLTPYGGTTTIVESNQDIANAFLALGILAVVDEPNLQICLENYTGTASNIDGCILDIFELTSINITPVCLVSGEYDFDSMDYIDLSAIGGSSQTPVTSEQSIINSFAALNYTIRFNGCQGEVISPTCTSLPDFAVVSADPVDAVDDDYSTFCTVENNRFLIEPLINDTFDGPVIITHINGAAINIGQRVAVDGGEVIYIYNNPPRLIIIADDVPGSYSFTYTISDGFTSDTATIDWCSVDPQSKAAANLQVECNSSNCTGILPGYTVTHISGVSVIADQEVEIIENQLYAYSSNLNNICLRAENGFSGSGILNYTIDNGSPLEVNVTFEVSECDLCADLDFGLSVEQNCLMAWTDLTQNSVAVDNYLIQFKDSVGNDVLTESGDLLQIAKGTYQTDQTLRPSGRIPLVEGQYTSRIVFSDIGNGIDCQTIQINPVPLDTLLDFVFNANLPVVSFNMIVGSSASIVQFHAGGVPDGILIEYNNNNVYYSGQSITCPYVSSAPNTDIFTACLGCSVTPSSSPIENVSITTTSVPNVPNVKVIVKGYPCDDYSSPNNPSVWILKIKPNT